MDRKPTNSVYMEYDVNGHRVDGAVQPPPMVGPLQH